MAAEKLPTGGHLLQTSNGKVDRSESVRGQGAGLRGLKPVGCA